MAYDHDVVQLFGAEYYYPCEPDSVLMGAGWVGGQWIRMQRMTTYPDGNEIRVRRVVEKALPDDPSFFLLRGSLEGTDQYTSFYPGRTGIATIGVYGQYLFKYYETLDLAERTVPGSGSTLVYVMNQDLYVSSNGLLTNEDETGTARTVGVLIGLPSDNNGYLGVFIGY